MFVPHTLWCTEYLLLDSLLVLAIKLNPEAYVPTPSSARSMLHLFLAPYSSVNELQVMLARDKDTEREEYEHHIENRTGGFWKQFSVSPYS